MKTIKYKQTVSLLLATSMTLSIAGCGDTDPSANSVDNNSKMNAGVSQISEVETENDTNEESTVVAASEDNAVDVETETVSAGEAYVEEAGEELGLTDQQRNSFSMLYYLAITAEEIRTSKDNRLLLDDIYTSLLNDINPSAIDETTQDHLQSLRDIIKSYRGISVKRERLQYIYNQQKATAIRSAVPNPVAILSVASSMDWKKLAVTVAYTVVDSYTNYKNATESADMEFLTSGWELDDEETETIQKNRDRAFDYMVDIVQEYGLDGKLTLNEESIEKFAELCDEDNIQQRIRLLESEEDTYKLLGNYWLELADSYFETDDYEKCLECVDKYNALSIDIYRQDYNYVMILPKAIVAAQEIYEGDEYVSNIEKFADAIIDNTEKTSQEEWSLRYYAAEVYLDLYERTGEKQYLEKAYNIAYDNVAVLMSEQEELNETYINDLVETTIDEPDYTYMSDDEKKEAKKEYKTQKKELKAYNKALKKARETELPTLYEPLVLNCDLLFGLADEMEIDDKEKSKIESMLQTDENGVFLTRQINDKYSFGTSKTDYTCELSKKEIVIPATSLLDGAKITVTVSENGKDTVFDDCNISKVERDNNDVDSFMAHISSKQMKKYKWTEDSKIEIKIVNDEEETPIIMNYKVSEITSKFPFSEKVVFEQV